MAVYKYLVGPGWWPIIDHHLARARKLDPDCDISVKEKYGLLRAHFLSDKQNMSNALHQIALEMEVASESVCQECGAPGHTVRENGWLVTLCDRCAALSTAERSKITDETMEKYYRGSHLRRGKPKNRQKVRSTRLSDFQEK